MNRRKFLAASAMSVVAARLPLYADGPGPVRQDVSTAAAASNLAKYASAVANMKALPAADPRNWTKQALIHLNNCPHRNWWFLPWHRAYLYYFEQICQDVLSDNSFRLPYWNWSAGNTVPKPFLDQGSTLWDRRAQTTVPLETVNTGLIQGIVASGNQLQLFSGATSTDQQRQQSVEGTLEATPHDTVHITLGGDSDDMATFMSPLDPIFWLHHCNLDRIWASWSIVSGHAQPTNALWSNHKLTTFYDPQTNSQVTPVVSAMPNGPFRVDYDSFVTVPTPRTLRANLNDFVMKTQSLSVGSLADQPLAAANLQKISGAVRPTAGVSLGSGANFSVPVSGNLRAFVEPISPVASNARATAISKETFLLIENVPRPSDPKISLRVFLNCQSPTTKTPTSDKSYVGTVSFFGDHTGMPGMPSARTFALSLSDALSRTIATGYAPNAPLEIGIVAVDLSDPNRVSTEEIVRPAELRVVALAEKL